VGRAGVCVMDGSTDWWLLLPPRRCRCSSRFLRLRSEEIAENDNFVPLPQRDAELDQHDGGGLVPSEHAPSDGGGLAAAVNSGAFNHEQQMQLLFDYCKKQGHDPRISENEKQAYFWNANKSIWFLIEIDRIESSGSNTASKLRSNKSGAKANLPDRYKEFDFSSSVYRFKGGSSSGSASMETAMDVEVAPFSSGSSNQAGPSTLGSTSLASTSNQVAAPVAAASSVSTVQPPSKKAKVSERELKKELTDQIRELEDELESAHRNLIVMSFPAEWEQYKQKVRASPLLLCFPPCNMRRMCVAVTEAGREAGGAAAQGNRAAAQGNRLGKRVRCTGLHLTLQQVT